MFQNPMGIMRARKTPMEQWSLNFDSGRYNKCWSSELRSWRESQGNMGKGGEKIILSFKYSLSPNIPSWSTDYFAPNHNMVVPKLNFKFM